MNEAPFTESELKCQEGTLLAYFGLQAYPWTSYHSQRDDVFRVSSSGAPRGTTG